MEIFNFGYLRTCRGWNFFKPIRVNKQSTQRIHFLSNFWILKSVVKQIKISVIWQFKQNFF